MGKTLVNPMGSSGGGIEWVELGKRRITGEDPACAALPVDPKDYDLLCVHIFGSITLTSVGSGYSPSLNLQWGGKVGVLSLGGTVGSRHSFDTRFFPTKGHFHSYSEYPNETYFVYGGVSTTSVAATVLSPAGGSRTGYSCDYTMEAWGGKFMI